MKARPKIERDWLPQQRAKSALGYRKVFAAAYQVAGGVVLAPDLYTEGQQKRLGVLLLDILSEPERYTPSLINDLVRLATEP